MSEQQKKFSCRVAPAASADADNDDVDALGRT
jgi:hypothetical protein